MIGVGARKYFYFVCEWFDAIPVGGARMSVEFRSWLNSEVVGVQKLVELRCQGW